MFHVLKEEYKYTGSLLFVKTIEEKKLQEKNLSC